MKVERASSVCSEDAPSSPDSIMSTGESPSLESPQPSPGPLTDPYDDQRMYSPAYTAPSPAYSTSSSGSGSSEAGSTGDASPVSSPGYQRSSSPDFGFQFPPDSGYPGVEQFGCQAEFVRAVQEGDPRELKRILTRYSQLVQINGFTADGQTALTQSCLDGNLEVVKMLVAHGGQMVYPARHVQPGQPVEEDPHRKRRKNGSKNSRLSRYSGVTKTAAQENGFPGSSEEQQPQQQHKERSSCNSLLPTIFPGRIEHQRDDRIGRCLLFSLPFQPAPPPSSPSPRDPPQAHWFGRVIPK